MKQLGGKKRNKISKYNVVCFGLMPWNEMWKRNQSMMAELSRSDLVHQVIFVNPIASLRNCFGGSHEKFPISVEARKDVFPWKVSSKIRVYQPVTFLPLKGSFPSFKKIEALLMYKVIHHLNGGMPYILFMNCPNIEYGHLLDRVFLDSNLSIFDFSDDFAELGNSHHTKMLFHNNSTKYASQADFVIAVNEHVKNKYACFNSNIHVIRNATNYKNFDRETYSNVQALEVIKRSKRPIIGYSGIANMGRIDKEVLDLLLSRKPNWQFVFVGPAHQNFVERYSTFSNIHIFNPVPYRDLPGFLKYFDVAIVPFQRNDNTKGNDLLKLHDYLAMGKPIVSTDIGGAIDLKDILRVAETPQDFLKGIEESLATICTEEMIFQRKRVAIKNSWETRISELEALIKENLMTKQELV